MKNIWKFLVCRITYSYIISNFSLYLKGTFYILHSEVYTDRKYEVKTLNFFPLKFHVHAFIMLARKYTILKAAPNVISFSKNKDI